MLHPITGRWLRLLIYCGLLSCCSGLDMPAAPIAKPIQFSEKTSLLNRSLEIRFSKSQHTKPHGILVLYSTGDGGWRGLDSRIFDWIASSGYTVAGFSSRSYLKILGSAPDGDTTTPIRLARDFRHIIGFARSRLGLPPATRVLLVGNSRGAGLSVVAAGEGELKPELAGVVAIALTREEEHVFHYHKTKGTPHGPPKEERVEILTYEYLTHLADIPLSVIQSENDGYLPASEARELFGPDTELHSFHPVKASNHSFKGGQADLQKELKISLQKMDGTHPDRTD